MVLIARYGEIFLKGKNRTIFEKKLADNIKKMFGVRVIRKRNRLLVEGEADLNQVFGIISYSPATEINLDMEPIKKKAWELARFKNFKTFKIAAKRMDSKVFSSGELNESVGGFIIEKMNKKVDLKKPDLEIGIELIDGRAYVFTEIISCFGGLPVGVEGKASLLIENHKSILAGLLMMKRGCDLEVVGFKEKDILLLQKFCPHQLKFKLINSLKELSKESSLVVGEDLKDNFGLVVLNPLVGLNEKEIKKYEQIYNSI